jgi:hypothetical protein
MKCTNSSCSEDAERILAVHALYSVDRGSIDGYCAAHAASVIRTHPGSFDVTDGSSLAVLKAVLGKS